MCQIKNGKQSNGYPDSGDRREKGSALLVSMLLILVGGVILGTLLTTTASSVRQTRQSVVHEMAYQGAEAGINRTIFQIEAALGTPGAEISLQEFLQSGTGNSYSGEVGETSYSVTIEDPSPGDDFFDLVATGNTPDGAERTLRATVKGQAIKALDYALFGNYIHFDNHNKVNFGVRLVTSVYSNSSIKVDPGIMIEGPVRAVQFIEASEASGGVSATVINPTAEQGDPDPSPEVDSAPVKQVQPAPPVWPFPVFDFPGVADLAAGAKRRVSSNQFEELLKNAYDYAKTLKCGEGECNMLVPLPQKEYPSGLNKNFIPVNVVHHYSKTERRFVRIPNGDAPNYTIDVGSPDGVAAGPDHSYEVILEGDPLPGNDSILYVDGSASIDLPEDSLVRIEGSLIVDGGFELNSGAELLAWENRTAPYFVPLGKTLYSMASSLDQVGPGDGFYDLGDGTPYTPTFDVRYSRYPALAANDKLKVSGDGGPAHIEGVVYTVEESHLHRSDPAAPAYSVGSEIADVIHNCQFFSFAYDPEARNTLGFGNRVTGRAHLTVVRFSGEEQ